MYLPYISQYFLGKYTGKYSKYCTVKGSITMYSRIVCFIYNFEKTVLKCMCVILITQLFWHFIFSVWLK